MRIASALALDIAFIVLFAAIGRRNHGETSALIGVLSTGLPFLAGMAAGWLAVLIAFRRAPLEVRDGILVWGCTVAIGMALRSLAGAGTAVSFVIVATLFLGTTLLGWRAVEPTKARWQAKA